MGCNCGARAPKRSKQKFTSTDGKVVKTVNSEIEAQALKARYGGSYKPV